MAILKKINGSYSNDDALYNLVNYILDLNKMPNRIVGGQGVYLNNVAICMNDIRCIFNHEGRQAEHYILSFTYEEAQRLCKQTALILGYRLCEFFEGVQALFAYHEVKDEANAFDNHNLHIHFAVGTTNLMTGKKYYTDKTEVFKFRNHAEVILNEMNISNEYLTLIFG
jgi:hypothetical protein